MVKTKETNRVKDIEVSDGTESGGAKGPKKVGEQKKFMSNNRLGGNTGDTGSGGARGPARGLED